MAFRKFTHIGCSMPVWLTSEPSRAYTEETLGRPLLEHMLSCSALNSLSLLPTPEDWNHVTSWGEDRSVVWIHRPLEELQLQVTNLSFIVVSVNLKCGWLVSPLTVWYHALIEEITILPNAVSCLVRTLRQYVDGWANVTSLRCMPWRNAVEIDTALVEWLYSGSSGRKHLSFLKFKMVKIYWMYCVGISLDVCGLTQSHSRSSVNWMSFWPLNLPQLANRI